MSNNIYNNLVKELGLGNQAIVVTYFEDTYKKRNKIIYKKMFSFKDIESKESMTDLGEGLYESVINAFELGRIQLEHSYEKGRILIEPYFPEPKLIILGGGHIAKPLVEFGSKLGFHITVIDDRPSFANRERFPEAEEVICESFEKCFQHIKLNMSSFVVIVTRGHRHDLICLKQVLKYKTAYVGMMGSKHRVGIVKENLFNEGFFIEEVNSLHAPIGLNIGALTPEEIAISILSEIISVKRFGPNNVDAKIYKKSGRCLEFDMEVLEELTKDSDEPRAIVTVISTKGSVPRHAGAKMIVWSYGRILGSIGGGCCEAEAILAARDIIKEGGYKIINIDMTNSDAENEGMVCGGTMQILIEACI